MNYNYDDVSAYLGNDVVINKNFIVKIPTLKEIIDFGEQRYFSAVRNLTSVGADLKFQLWDEGIDYTQIEDYDLFIKLISQLVSSKKKLHDEIINASEEEREKYKDIDLNELDYNPLQLVLKDIDFADFEPYMVNRNKDIILYNKDKDITFDRMTYSLLIDTVRKIHGFKRNNETPANERTKMDLIEDARDEAMALRSKPYKSILKPSIATIKIKYANYNVDTILNTHISAFFYDMKKIMQVQEAELLLKGAYSGFASLKGIDKSRLDIFRDLES